MLRVVSCEGDIRRSAAGRGQSAPCLFAHCSHARHRGSSPTGRDGPGRLPIYSFPRRCGEEALRWPVEAQSVCSVLRGELCAGQCPKQRNSLSGSNKFGSKSRFLQHKGSTGQITMVKSPNVPDLWSRPPVPQGHTDLMTLSQAVRVRGWEHPSQYSLSAAARIWPSSHSGSDGADTALP